MPTIVRACFQNQCEICTCGSRILVHRERIKAFMAASSNVAALKVGDPLDEETDLGPLVSAAHRDGVEAAIARAVKEGGTVACGGGRPKSPPDRVRNGPSSSRRCSWASTSTPTNQHEIFGPVVTVQGFDTRERSPGPTRPTTDSPARSGPGTSTAHRMAARTTRA